MTSRRTTIVSRIRYETTDLAVLSGANPFSPFILNGMMLFVSCREGNGQHGNGKGQLTRELKGYVKKLLASAPKARNVIAQGNALGDAPLISGSAEGANKESGLPNISRFQRYEALD